MGGFDKVDEHFSANKVTDHTVVINEKGYSSSVLVVGSEKALVVDTLNGFKDYKEELKKYTNKPLFVVITHGHPDHASGNKYFEKVYMDYDDLPLLKICCGAQNCDADLSPIKPGGIISLGDGHDIEVISCKGHTQGSIVLLDRKDRTLYSGDSVIPHEWLQLRESTSVAKYKEELDNLMKYRGEFDHILHGHGGDYEDANLLDELYAAINDILEGKTQNDEAGSARDYFADCMIHYYGDPQKGRRVLYQKDKIR